MDAGNNETEYVLTESYELSDWDSDSVSFSIGYSTEFSFPGGKASIETGYALDWTKSFERSLARGVEPELFCNKPTTVLLSAVHRCSSTNMTYRMRTAHGTIKLSCRLPFRRDLCMSSFGGCLQ